MLEQNLIDEILTGFYDLPTLPGIAVKLLEAANRPEPELKELAGIIATDPPLSAKVIELINSAIMGIPQKIISVPHAINLLGFSTVKNLALSFSIVRNFKQKGVGFDYSAFWKKSLVSAISTRFIFKQTHPQRAEDAFFLGLLHNIGMLALNQCMVNQYAHVLERAAREQAPVEDIESEALGFTHAEIGQSMAESWGLPAFFSLPIRHHHSPEKMTDQPSEAATLARALFLGTWVAEFICAADKADALLKLEHFGQEFKLLKENRHNDLVAEIQKQTDGVFPLFELEVSAAESYTEMLEDTRRQVVNINRKYMSQLIEKDRQIKQLREQVGRDGLTGLFNYQKFYEIFNQEYHRATRYGTALAVCIGDIDFFKRINDIYGHLAGDFCIKEVAGVLKSRMRQSDVLARYGGEEFAMIFPETASKEALAIANRLEEAVAGLKIDHEGNSISVTMSFGVAAISPENLVKKQDLIKRSDEALYRAKRAGRRQCCLW